MVTVLTIAREQSVRFAARLVMRQWVFAIVGLGRTMALYRAIYELKGCDRIGFVRLANDFDLLDNPRYYRRTEGKK